MLEDTYADVIGKAIFGLHKSLDTVASESGLSKARLSALLSGAPPTETEIRATAAALSLDGQKLVVRQTWEPAPIATSSAIKRIIGYLGDYPVNGYLLVGEGVGVLFDTANRPEAVLKTLEKASVPLVAICITHTHPDHVGGVEMIQAATGAPVYCHAREYKNGRYLRGSIFLEEGVVFPLPTKTFGMTWRETPGHTAGGVTFLAYIPALIAFTGDALFAGSVGRAQSPATYATLLQSVQNNILSLPPETVLFPGHGEATTVWEERHHNPFFKDT